MKESSKILNETKLVEEIKNIVLSIIETESRKERVVRINSKECFRIHMDTYNSISVIYEKYKVAIECTTINPLLGTDVEKDIIYLVRISIPEERLER